MAEKIAFIVQEVVAKVFFFLMNIITFLTFIHAVSLMACRCSGS